MNRLLCIGTLSTIAMVQLLKVVDPQNLLFEVVSVGHKATILQIIFAALLLIIGIQGYFTNKYLRLASTIGGLSLIVLGIFSLVYPILDAPLKPFDLAFILEGGIIFSLAGISVSEEAQQEALQDALLLQQYGLDEVETTETKKQVRPKIAYN